MKLLKSIALAAAVFTAPLASADVVEWNFNATLEWITAGSGAPTFSAGGGTQLVSSSSISWGDNDTVGENHTVSGNARSGVDVTAGNVAGSVFTNGPWALTNALTHFNNSISGSFATMQTATLLGTLMLTPADPVGPALPAIMVPFGIQFIETPNDGDCDFPATSNCDDIFVMTFGNLNNQFVYDGVTYFLSLVETTGGLAPLHPDACAQAGAAAGCFGFQTREGEFTPAQFAILITSRPVDVPAPGALALMGLGLLALRQIRRKAA